MKSKLWGLNTKDAIKGLVVAVFGAVLQLMLTALETSGIDSLLADWKQILTVGLVAGLSYLLKNFLTDENDKVVGLG